MTKKEILDKAGINEKGVCTLIGGANECDFCKILTRPDVVIEACRSRGYARLFDVVMSIPDEIEVKDE